MLRGEQRPNSCESAVAVGAKAKIPVTPAVRVLRAHSVAFEPRLYEYVERGGTARSAAELGVDEHIVIKTIVLQTSDRKPMLALINGGKRGFLVELDPKDLARIVKPELVEIAAG